MKKILSLLMLTACILAACTSVDDTLKPSDDIYVSVLETQDTVRVIPGDTVHFHFMVSTNNGAITRIEFVSDESIIEGHPEKMTFSLIDTTMTLTADAEGYLSREVSSLVVDYPCYVKPNPAILGGTQQITFRATNKPGRELHPLPGIQLAEKHHDPAPHRRLSSQRQVAFRQPRRLPGIQ